MEKLKELYFKDFETESEKQKRLIREKENQKIKELLSVQVLNYIQDQSIQDIIREIVFNDKNYIKWNDVKNTIKVHMPELNL